MTERGWYGVELRAVEQHRVGYAMGSVRLEQGGESGEGLAAREPAAVGPPRTLDRRARDEREPHGQLELLRRDALERQPRLARVGEGLEQHEVRDLADFHGPERVRDAQPFRRPPRRRLDRLGRRHPERIDEDLELFVERGAREDVDDRHVGAGHQPHAGFVHLALHVFGHGPVAAAL